MTITRTVSIGALPVVNVKSYGARGNGTTDDSAAFLAAITAAAGAPVYVPSGRYRVALTLTDQDVHLTGPGTLVQTQNNTLLSCTRTFGAPISVTQSTVQVGPNLPASTTATQTITALTVSGGDYTVFRGGDVYHIASQDTYGWSVAGLGAGATVWQAGFVPVLGVGISLATVAGGGPAEGATITGGTTGATATVQSVAVDGTTARVVTQRVTGNFSVGETLTVAGSPVGTVGSMFLAMAGRLTDTYTTSPVIRKVPTTGKFVIDGLTVEADTDVDAIVGAANRDPAILLSGVYRPVVRDVRIRSAWSRAVELLACYLGDIDIVVDQLPNHALEIEAGYGYGVELGSATEGTRVKCIARNVRTAVTTNTTTGGYLTANLFFFGTPKWNLVHDSQALSPVATGFSTHPGAYFTTFDNCRTVHPGGANRYLTSGRGFQNRGFGTTFRNCTAYGAIQGFMETPFDAGFTHVTRYETCSADEYQQVGFVQEAGTASRVEYLNCSARGDGSGTNTPYLQSGFEVRSGRIVLRGCASERFNGAPFRLAAAASVVVDGCFADYIDTPDFCSGLRVDVTQTALWITNYTARVKASGTPTAVLRNSGGDTAWAVSNINVVNVAVPPPLFSSAAGSPTFAVRDLLGGVQPTNPQGDVSVTLTPRSNSPVQIWNTPLTTARTVTLSTTGAVNGDSFRVVRTAAATGASTLTVASRTLSAGQWADVTYDGTTWSVTAAGSL